MHALPRIDWGRRGCNRAASVATARNGPSRWAIIGARVKLLVMNNVSLGERLPPDIFFRFHQAQSHLSSLSAAHCPCPRNLVFRLLASVLDGDLADLRKAEKV